MSDENDMVPMIMEINPVQTSMAKTRKGLDRIVSITPFASDYTEWPASMDKHENGCFQVGC